eukprot:2715116-Rhodomonas_salina.1
MTLPLIPVLLPYDATRMHIVVLLAPYCIVHRLVAAYRLAQCHTVVLRPLVAPYAVCSYARDVAYGPTEHSGTASGIGFSERTPVCRVTCPLSLRLVRICYYYPGGVYAPTRTCCAV